jgi:hypothetical protein
MLQRDYWQTSEFRKCLAAFIFKVRQPKFGLLACSTPFVNVGSDMNKYRIRHNIHEFRCGNLRCHIMHEIEAFSGLYSLGDSIIHKRIYVCCNNMSWVRDPRQLLWGLNRGYGGDTQTMRRDAPKFRGIFQNIFSFNLCVLSFQTAIRLLRHIVI